MTTEVSDRDMSEIELGPSKNRDEQEALDAFDEEKPSEAGRSLFCIVAIVLAAVSVLGQAAAIFIVQKILVIVAGAVAVVVAPFVVMAELELRGLDTLRTVHNQLRKQVARMQVENDKLSGNIDELEGGVGRLKESEQQFSSLAEQQGLSVDRLVGLVEENQKTLDAMQQALMSEVTQDLIQKVMESDTDEDMHITEFEIDILVMHLSSLDSVKSIDQDRFRAKIEESGGSVTGVLDIVRDMISHEDGGDGIIQISLDNVSSHAG